MTSARAHTHARLQRVHTGSAGGVCVGRDRPTEKGSNVNVATKIELEASTVITFSTRWRTGPCIVHKLSHRCAFLFCAAWSDLSAMRDTTSHNMDTDHAQEHGAP